MSQHSTHTAPTHKFSERNRSRAITNTRGQGEEGPPITPVKTLDPWSSPQASAGVSA